jgi:adenosylcobalamin-dependent ribonucleoside-triphosphate reductase
LGTGVGFRILPSDVEQLPTLKNKNIQIVSKEYEPKAKKDRREFGLVSTEGTTAYFEIGDSRVGWIEATMFLLNVATLEAYQDITTIRYNYDSVRPAGERIMGFGGTASGPFALQGILGDVCRIINEIPSDCFRPIDCLDICCACAKGIVAGSSRRSALISLFDAHDEECKTCKTGLWTNPDLAHKSYRSQVNITAMQEEKPSLEYLRELVSLQSFRENGEPGIDNVKEMKQRRREAAIQYRPNADPENYTNVVTNPCHEILLSTGIETKEVETAKSGSFCNLCTLPLPNFVKDGKLDYEELEQCVRLNTRIGLRQTFIEIPLKGWNETQLEERLLGVSCTGWQDAFDLLNISATSPESIQIRELMREWANTEATIYADKLGCPRPLLVTTIKPEGTQSQIYGVSSGLHYNWAPFYIRRVRMTALDALAQTLMDQGYPCYPEVYELDNIRSYVDQDCIENWGDNWSKLKAFDSLDSAIKREILNSCNTVVFEFPVSSPAKRAQDEVSVLEQLESMRLFSVHYTDHMPSSTITVKEDEWDDIPQWIYDNWDRGFVTASFLPHYGGKYPLLPFEKISEEEYERRLAAIPQEWIQVNDNRTITFAVDEDLMVQYERKLEDPDDVEIPNMECSTGSCPIR